MTFAQQLKKNASKSFMGTLALQLKQEEGLQAWLQQGREESIHLNAIAKKLIAQGRSIHIFKT